MSKKPIKIGSFDHLQRCAAIDTVSDLKFSEEYEVLITNALVLIDDVLRDACNAQDECEKFLREYAPKVLALHYSENENSHFEAGYRSFVRLFQSRFAELVKDGRKTQTVRAVPKRIPFVGDCLDAREWEGKPYRSKQRKLGRFKITAVEEVWIGWNGVKVGGLVVDGNEFARADGFEGYPEMFGWFLKNQGIPIEGFRGILISWEYVKGKEV